MVRKILLLEIITLYRMRSIVSEVCEFCEFWDLSLLGFCSGYVYMWTCHCRTTDGPFIDHFTMLCRMSTSGLKGIGRGKKRKEKEISWVRSVVRGVMQIILVLLSS